MSSFAFNSFNLKGSIKTVQPFYMDSPKQRGIPINVDGVRYISASTIRGALRHSAHNVAAMYLASQGKLLDLETHFALAIGYDLNHRAAPSSFNSECGYYFQKIREKNAFISLFGRWMLASRLGVGNAYATSDDVLVESESMRLQNMFEKKPDLISLLDVPNIESLEAILMSSSKNYNGDTLEVVQIQKKIKEYRAKIEANKVPLMNKMLETQVKAFEAELTSIMRTTKVKKVSKEIDSIEMIKAGVEFDNKITVKNASNLEFQTLLFAIYALSLNPYLGARFGTGMGQIEASWEIHKTDIFKTESTVIGKVGFNETGFYSEITDKDYQLNEKNYFVPTDYYNLLDSNVIDLNMIF